MDHQELHVEVEMVGRDGYAYREQIAGPFPNTPDGFKEADEIAAERGGLVMLYTYELNDTEVIEDYRKGGDE